MTLTRHEAEDFLFLEAELLDDWLMEESDELSPKEKRNAYRQFLYAKLEMIDTLSKEAKDAR